MNESLAVGPQKVYATVATDDCHRADFRGQWVLLPVGLWCTNGELVVLLPPVPPSPQVFGSHQCYMNI